MARYSERGRDALGMVLRRKTDARSAMANRREAWKTYLRNFLQVYETEDEAKYTNNVFSVVTADTVLTLHAFLTQGRPPLVVQPAPDGGGALMRLPAPERQALMRRLQAWHEHQWYVQRMDEKRDMLALHLLLYGTAVLYSYYRVTTEGKPVRMPDGSWSKPVDTVVYDDPDCEVVDVVRDFFPDPTGSDIDACGWVIHRRLVSAAEVESWRGGANPWIDRAAPIDALAESYLRGDDGDDSDFDRYSDYRAVSDCRRSGNVEILEYWEDDRLVVVANRAYVLRDGPNPHFRLKKKPFTLFRDVPHPHGMWGIGEGELLAKLQHEQNTLKRMRIDAAKLSIRQRWAAPSGSNFDPSSLYDEDCLVAESPLAQYLVPLPTPDMSRVGLPSEMDLQQQAENVTGVGPLFKGQMGGGGSETATSKQIQQTNMMQRAVKKVDQFSRGIQRWMEIGVELAYQYYEPSRAFVGRGRETQGMTFDIQPDDFMSGAMVEVQSSSARPYTAQDRMMLSDMLFSRYLNNPMIDQRRLVEIDLALKELPAEYSDLLKSREQIEQETQVAMQAQRQEQDDQFEREAAMEAIRKMQSPQPGDDQMAPGTNAMELQAEPTMEI